MERDLLRGVSHPRPEVAAVDQRQAIADHQAKQQEDRQPGIVEIALHPLRQVEEALLKHVGGIDPPPEPFVDAELDHAMQAIAMPLEQVGQGLAIPGADPLEQTDRFTGRVVHDLAPTL